MTSGPIDPRISVHPVSRIDDGNARNIWTQLITIQANEAEVLGQVHPTLLIIAIIILYGDGYWGLISSFLPKGISKNRSLCFPVVLIITSTTRFASYYSRPDVNTFLITPGSRGYNVACVPHVVPPSVAGYRVFPVLACPTSDESHPACVHSLCRYHPHPGSRCSRRGKRSDHSCW